MTPLRLAALIAGLLVLAAPAAWAQATQGFGRTGQLSGACGQPLALTYTLALPVDEVAAEALDVEILRAEPFYVEFKLARESRTVLRTETPAGEETDPHLTLFTASGGVAGADDDSAGGLDSLLDLTLAPGTYCAQVRPLYGSAELPQRVTLHLATGEAADALAGARGASAGQAAFCSDPALTSVVERDLAPGLGVYTLEASIAPGSRRDWVLRVTEAMEFQAMTVATQFDTTLTLSDISGAIVAENDDGYGIGTDSRISLALEPGEYCLSLSGYEGEGGRADVALTDAPDFALVGPLSTACTDPALTSDFGRPLAPGLGAHSVEGSVTPMGRSDWTVEVTEAVLLQFDATSAEFDTVMSIVDASGQVIEQNDDYSSDNVNSRIVRRLEPGRYCVAVEGYDGEAGRFQLAVTDAPASAPVAEAGAAGLCAAPEITADLGRTLAPGMGTISVPATVEPGSRQDWTLTVDAAVALRIDARSAVFDTMLRLGVLDGPLVAENDDGPAGGTDSQVEVTLAPGRYCLSLEGFAGSGGTAELALTEIDAGAMPEPSAGAGEAVPGPDSGIAVEELGVLADRLATDAPSPDLAKWVAFSMEDEAEVRIDAIALGGGFALRLFTEAGEFVDESRSSGGISPARIERRLAPGRYLVAVALEPYVTSRLRSIEISRR